MRSRTLLRGEIALSPAHIDYSSFFHPLANQARLAEVANWACLEQLLDRTDLRILERSACNGVMERNDRRNSLIYFIVQLVYKCF